MHRLSWSGAIRSSPLNSFSGSSVRPLRSGRFNTIRGVVPARGDGVSPVAQSWTADLKQSVVSSPSGWLVAVGILFVVICHYWVLDKVPSGFFVDEAGIAYAASGISLDGQDEHGAAWPIFFEGFGEWKSPLLIYLIAGAMRLFGPGIVIVRSVPTTLSLLTAVLLGVLVWRTFRIRWLAWCSFFVAGVLPWLFGLGRIGLEVSSLPPLLLLSLLLWWKADRESSLRAALLAGGVLGLATYAYPTARLYVPLLLVALLVSELPGPRWRLVAIAWLGGGLMMLPLLLFNQGHPGALIARYQLISVFTDAHSPLEALDRVWRVYTSGFSLRFLFWQTAWWQGGEFFAVLALPLVLGLVALWRRRRDPFWRYVALGLVLGPIPAALTYDFSHELRNLETAPFFLLVMAAGVAEIQPLLVREKMLAGALAALLAAQVAVFMSDYFTGYPVRVAEWHEQGFDQATLEANSRSHSLGTPVLLSSRIFAAEILYAYYSREDVRLYRKHGIGGAGAHIVDLQQGGQPPSRGLVVSLPDERPDHGTLLKVITIPYHDDWGRPKTRQAYLIWLVS